MREIKNHKCIDRNVDDLLNHLPDKPESRCLVAWLKFLGLNKVACRFQKNSFNVGDVSEYGVKVYLDVKGQLKVEINNKCDMVLEGVECEAKYIALNACSASKLKEHNIRPHYILLNTGYEMILAKFKNVYELNIDKHNHISRKNNIDLIKEKGKVIFTYKG